MWHKWVLSIEQKQRVQNDENADSVSLMKICTVLFFMQDQISDKASIQYQRLSWEALKKSINGLINKANVSNLVHIVRELFQENIVRGRLLMWF